MSLSKYILIDTSKLNIDDKSKFTFYLNKVITIKKYIKINYILIPKTNFVINSTIGNNLFNITINGQTYNYIIPSSYYRPQDLCSVIQGLVNQNGFTCVYDSNTY